MAELSSSVSLESRVSCSSVSLELTSQTVSQEARDSCSSVSQELTSQTDGLSRRQAGRQEGRSCLSVLPHHHRISTTCCHGRCRLCRRSCSSRGRGRLRVDHGRSCCAGSFMLVCRSHGLHSNLLARASEASLSFREASRNSPLSWPSEQLAAFHAPPPPSPPTLLCTCTRTHATRIKHEW